jgi:hydrophobic/amphiphilic exporter-1 (mainly G- bacteria), HAE1 family
MTDERQGWLPRLSVHRPVTVMMILVSMLVVGVIAYIRIPMELFPEGLEENMLIVFVPVPNATPKDVEETVARPIEDIIGTIPKVKRIYSRANAGGCFVRITFQNGADMKASYAELRDRMDRVMPDMPDEVERIYVRRFDENDIPIMYMALTLPPEVTDPQYTVDSVIKPAFQRIDGVGSVEVNGLRTKDIIIELNQEKVLAHNIDTALLVNRLRGQDSNVPGGWVIEGGKKFYVRSLGRYTSPEEVENLVIEPVTGLRLKDIAVVAYRAPRQDQVYWIGGHPAVGLAVIRSSGANIVDISKAVHATLAELKQQPQLASTKVEIFWDQGRHVRASIDNLRDSGLWGGFFAAIILFAFLRAPRMTAIITLAIPLSLLTTVVVLFFMGWTLNMATMMGLLLSVGMVVDNSIVIVENIYRRRQEGYEAKRASIEGAGEVGLAVVMATLTTVVVFLPLILMGSDQEFTFWMLRIGIPVIMALLASLFIALVFIPLAALKLSRGKHHDELRLISWVRERYLALLRLALKRRLEAALLAILAMASIVIPQSMMKRDDRGGGGDDNVWVFLDMPTGQSLEQASAFITRVESAILTKREAYDIQLLETRFRRDGGRIQILRTEPESLGWYEVTWNSILEKFGMKRARMTRKAIEEDLKEVIEVPPGFRMRNSWRDREQDASVAINVYGDDTDTLVGIATEVERRLMAIPEVIGVDTEMERGGDELQIRLDRDQARRLGVDPQVVSANISSTLRGLKLSDFSTDDGRQIAVRLQLEEDRDKTLGDVREMTFRNREGRQVPLESIADLYVTRTLGQIQREDRQTMLRISAGAKQEDMKTLGISIDRAMAGLELPRGYRWDKGARFNRMQESDDAQTFAMLMAVSFVFFLMGVLFESFLLPLAVIISIPFAFLGVYWTLFLTGTPFDIMAGIGVVILVGVVVNNAIVLVDLVNRLRAEGHDRFESLVEAARHRFRPILMTTLTTACGLIPMALGDSKLIDMSYAPLGRAMMGGLLCATVLTLVVVPLFYTFLDDLRGVLMCATASVFHRGPATMNGPGVAEGQATLSRGSGG